MSRYLDLIADIEPPVAAPPRRQPSAVSGRVEPPNAPEPSIATEATKATEPGDEHPWSTLPATPDYERRVGQWLVEIGETDPECIEQVVAAALADPLSLAACVPPPDPIAEAVALVRAGHRVELYSATLGTRFTLVPDEAAAAVERAEGRVPHTLSEIAALVGWDADDLCLAHAIKAKFDASARGSSNG